ncbi:hypothetical protein A9D60_17500 [Leisingera sp. JC1]|nr:hypothetical protein A9D60_17500 [Leisingera sp. JC1]
MQDERTDRVTFFASKDEPTTDFLLGHGIADNLPLVAILAEGRMLGPVKMFVVGDSTNFLMANRMQRAGEIKEVTDEAVRSGKAHFSRTRAPFTAHLSPEAAVEVLSKLETELLTSETVNDYRAMLNRTKAVWK